MLSLLSFVTKAHAAEVDLGDSFTLGIGEGKVSDVYKTPADLVNLIANNLFIIGGIIIFFMFLLAGFKFMGDTTKGKDEALGIIKTALIGFILMFSAFWIVQILKLITGADINL